MRAVEYDPAVLEIVAQRFRRDMWESVTFDAVVESGVEVQRFGPVQATTFADLPETHSLNQIQGAAEPEAIESGHLAEAIEWMRAREVDYRVPVATSRPGSEEAEAWLGDRGYERGSGLVKFVRDTAPPDLPEDLSITIYELGESEADGEGMSAIVAEAFEMPLTAGTLFFSLPMVEHWRCYTAALTAAEGVVATASMLIDGGIAQLGPAATLEQGRNRGCQLALLRRLLLDAAEAGCHTVFLELAECDGERLAAVAHLLRRAGFQEAYESRTWRRPALRSARVY